MTWKEYWKDVSETAEEIVKGDHGYEDLHDAVHEEADRAIIYTHDQRMILVPTVNDPDGGEIAAMSDGTWEGMHATAAYLAYSADLWDHIHTLQAKEPA